MTAVLPETLLPELTIIGGLAGFPDSERYALVEVPETAPLFLLRSLDEAGLEFVVVPPHVFFPDYAPELDDATVARLNLSDPDDALLLVVLTLGERVEDATANLLAPLVISQSQHRAAQVVLQGDFSLRSPLRHS